MAESLTFNVGADTSGFQTGIGGMLTGLAGLAAAFVSVQAVVEGFSNAIEMGGRLHDLSTRTGETAGNLAILERAFENASVGAEKLGPAIAKMQKSMVDMQQGSIEAASAFEQLGLSWADLEGKSPAEQMELIGIRLSAIEDPALRAETAMKIFGKSGAELIPVLTNFSAETALAKEQLGSLPEQLDSSAAAVDQFGDNLSAISNKMTEFAYGFLSEVMPALNMFTDRLAGLDAAAIGAGLADALVGAFVDPMRAASLLGETLLLGVKQMGNEMVYQIRYWTDVMEQTFRTLGLDIIPMLGNNMLGAFEIAAGGLGEALLNSVAGMLSALEPVAGMFGMGEELQTSIAAIQDLAQQSQNLMVDGAAKIAESSNAFASAFAGAQVSSTVVRQDFFGAEASSARIADDFASLQDSAKAAMSSLGVTPEMAASRTTTGTDTILLDAIQKADAAALVNQTPIITSTATTKGKTAAQLQAEFNKTLGLIASADPNQLIGQSASARMAQSRQKELDTLIALGKGDSTEANALRQSIQRNQDIAMGVTFTAEDERTAQEWAFEQYFLDSSKSVDEWEAIAKENMMEQKRSTGKTDAETQAQKAKDAGLAKDQQQGKTIQSVAQAVLAILQKIEPKLPQHIMS